MKRILTYTIFCLLFVLTSCSEEQLDVYNGDNYVYFTYMSDKSPQKITFNFATDAPLLREGTVKVKMTLLGYLLEENATCDISAVGEKSTARSGIDYAPLTSGIFHSGLAEDTYEVTVYRNEDTAQHRLHPYPFTGCSGKLSGGSGRIQTRHDSSDRPDFPTCLVEPEFGSQSGYLFGYEIPCFYHFHGW